MNTARKFDLVLCLLLATSLASGVIKAQTLKENPGLDKKVEKFLEEHAGQWYNMNVPARDGQLLYDLIIQGNYKSALEIGTSTGHSGIFIAWALSKTGGKLITIDKNESSHKTAFKNFKEAGLSDYIDARLADAHTLVKELEGPFDFVFSDADKNWYKNYFMDVDPKLIVGGCYTTHNIRDSHRDGNQKYLEYIRSLKTYETTLNSAGGGVLISYKRAE
ncbi:MAG: methyltransferase [Bacteroidetes bacterium]|nr:methyltransferase [Bacteroidota bacterium]